MCVVASTQTLILLLVYVSIRFCFLGPIAVCMIIARLLLAVLKFSM